MNDLDKMIEVSTQLLNCGFTMKMKKNRSREYFKYECTGPMYYTKTGPEFETVMFNLVYVLGKAVIYNPDPITSKLVHAELDLDDLVKYALEHFTMVGM